METQNQQEIWDKIASDWNKFKKTPDERVAEFVKNAKGNLLDLGCGGGRNFVQSKATVYGIDFSKKMIKYAKEKAKKLESK